MDWRRAVVIGCCLAAPTPIRAQSWQRVEVVADVGSADQLRKGLMPLGPEGLGQRLSERLDKLMKFWHIVPVRGKAGNLPRLTVEFVQEGGQVMLAKSLRFTLKLTPRPATDPETYHHMCGGPVAPQGEYSSLLDKQPEGLADEIARRVEAVVNKAYKDCEEEMKRVPIAVGVVRYPGRGQLAIPLEATRFGPYVRSTFKVEVKNGGTRICVGTVASEMGYWVLEHQNIPDPWPGEHGFVWLDKRVDGGSSFAVEN